MLGSELISRIADAISRYGDKPVVAYQQRADELVEVDGIYVLVDTNFMTNGMETEQSTVFEIEF
jgi:hypothetical protein